MDKSDPFHLFPYRAIVDHPPVAWPNGAKVAVWVIPNIEHFHWEIGSGAPDAGRWVEKTTLKVPSPTPVKLKLAA